MPERFNAATVRDGCRDIADVGIDHWSPESRHSNAPEIKSLLPVSGQVSAHSGFRGIAMSRHSVTQALVVTD